MKQEEFYDFIVKLIKRFVYCVVGLYVFSFLLISCGLFFGGN